MTMTAIAHSTGDDLKELGLVSKGDRLTLVNFCRTPDNTEANERKASLLSKILRNNKAKRSTEISAVSHGKKPKGDIPLKKIKLGWLHYQEKDKKYLSIRETKGGGTRGLEFPLDATADDIIAEAKELFFPKGVSSYGKEKDMTFHLANFQQEPVNTLSVSGSVLPFTLQRYMNLTKLPRIRLYLASRLSTETKQPPDNKEDSDSDDGLLCQSALFTSSFMDSNVGQETSSSLSQAELQEIRVLKANQDKEYQASLEADQAKEKQLQCHLKEFKEQERLRKAREMRVLDEPDKSGDEVVLIQIRHLTLGVINRCFKDTDKLQSVYDWVGSLSLIPMHFELSDFSGYVYLPEESVKVCEKTTLNMTASERTPSLDDGEVNFNGFGLTGIEQNDTLTIPPVEDYPPDLMFTDEQHSILEQ